MYMFFTVSGFYCPNGTHSPTAFPCPAGTFNNISGLAAESDCFACIGGHYCPSGGVVHPYLLCSAGFYCRSGAETATPMEVLYIVFFMYLYYFFLLGVVKRFLFHSCVQDSEAYECPRGFYCPEGSSEPTACPVGTFSNTTRLRNDTDCTDCTPGKTRKKYRNSRKFNIQFRYFCRVLLRQS